MEIEKGIDDLVYRTGNPDRRDSLEQVVFLKRAYIRDRIHATPEQIAKIILNISREEGFSGFKSISFSFDEYPEIEYYTVANKEEKNS